MTMTETGVYYDMYDREIYASPHETYRRLRNEAPLYYNEKYDFYAVSRHADVGRVLDRPGHLHLRQGGCVQHHLDRHRDAPRALHLRGPALPHHAPEPRLATLHAQGGERAWSRRSENCASRSSTSSRGVIVSTSSVTSRYGYPCRSSACWWACPRPIRPPCSRPSRRTFTSARPIRKPRPWRGSSRRRHGSTNTWTGARRIPPMTS